MKHHPTVAEIWQALEEWAPASLAEEWDNVGVQVGHPDAKVTRLVIALDVTRPLVEHAAEQGAEMILTHHPLIFTPLKKIDLSEPLPSLIAYLLEHGIALASAHTNLDSAKNGVSDQIARMLGLKDTVPMIPAVSDPTGEQGLGRTGIMPEPKPLREIIDILASNMRVPGLAAAGDPAMDIEKVSVCGGSGSSLWPVFVQSGADLFVSAEIKHSIYREAEMLGLAVIDAGHFATEWPIIPELTRFMKDAAAERKWDIEVAMFSDEETPSRWYPAG